MRKYLLKELSLDSILAICAATLILRCNRAVGENLLIDAHLIDEDVVDAHQQNVCMLAFETRIFPMEPSWRRCVRMLPRISMPMPPTMAPATDTAPPGLDFY